MVKVSLAVNTVTGDFPRNLEQVVSLAEQASSAGAGLVLFPEAALTGLVNNDDPAHDLTLGEPVPGPATSRLAGVARARNLYIALGLLERDGEVLYDSAVLLDPEGRLLLRYRRVTRGWHGRRAGPTYGHGLSVDTAMTSLGTAGFLICGDLFDEDLVSRARAARLHILLCPMARNFEDGSYDQVRWEREEEPEYGRQAARVGAVTLLANYLGDPGWDPGVFGGAVVFAPDGKVLARFPLGRSGLLTVDLPAPGQIASG